MKYEADEHQLAQVHLQAAVAQAALGEFAQVLSLVRVFREPADAPSLVLAEKVGGHHALLDRLLASRATFPASPAACSAIFHSGPGSRPYLVRGLRGGGDVTGGE
ncbi:hypothetical protein OHU11_00425 [Streptomyces sp. NBC_00257]|uniref:hypothetical protein n=1 Tax=unclassified Streptomyces TaxID=2593676 RepID=UPI0022584190|nr:MULTISPECIES: hypothetical protein [unclassified Streptomyces]MCX5426252.1 hypothetical protein [Streptomyces sp. NBC_00062]